MKKILFFLLSLVFSTILLAQTEDCDNFNSFAVSPWANDVTCPVDPPILGNWQAREAHLRYDNFESIGGASDIYLRIRDDYSNCLSWIYNGVDYTGDWSEIGDCFCYDFNFFSSTGAPAPASLIHIYAGSSDLFSATHIAKFVLYDEVSANDGWVNICPPLFLSNSGLPTNEFGYWKMEAPFDGGVADWNYLLQNVSGIAFFVDISSGIELYGVDNICFKNDCPPSQELEPPFCCEGQNLIANGGFDIGIGGDLGFTSEFMPQSVISSGSILPGQFGIVTGEQASTVSSTWSNVSEPNFCSQEEGTFLIVNGENGGGDNPLPLANSIPTQKIIWEQTVSIEDWRGYKFCFRAKNLDQCGFNVTPKINVEFSMPVGDISETILTSVDQCDWQEITKYINLWGYGNSLNIKIVLDQSEFGDGNDIAIDDISLVEIPQMGDEYAVFGYTPVPIGGGLWNVSVNASIPLPEGCDGAWTIKTIGTEIDPDTGEPIEHEIYNSSNWWSIPDYKNTTNFPGFDGTSIPTTVSNSTSPGIFDVTKFTYLITHGVYCECNSWNQWTGGLNLSANGRYLEIKDVKANKVIKRIRIKGRLRQY